MRELLAFLEENVDHDAYDNGMLVFYSSAELLDDGEKRDHRST